MTELIKSIQARFHSIFIFSCIATFILAAIRSSLVPFAHDEVATFYYYIQSESFLPFYSHIDANGHFLNSFLSWMAYKCFGSSEFALRLPGLMAFVILCISVYKFNQSFTSLSAKIILIGSFILSFHILNFYSLCRGYGLSISFLLLGLYYFFSYLKSLKFPDLIKCYLFLQLALGAALTLVFTLLIIGGIVAIIEFKNKVLFTAKNLIAHAVYFSLILFWIKYGFYLQENGALYYGGGDSYWTVTFKSLIDTVFIPNTGVYIAILLLFTFVAAVWLKQFFAKKLKFIFESRFAISFLMLVVLMAAFYLLKLLLGVNYPEDRTGLFFYILFCLSVAFLCDEFTYKFNAVFYSLPLFFITHFALSINIGKHAWGFYETMPKDFYEALVSEQKATERSISVGGHRVLELFYSFYNYNNTEKLNHMVPPEQMHMNCDYYLTWLKDEPYYKNYYSEMARDKYWNMVLLKRKESINRQLVYELKTEKLFEGSEEFYPVYEKLDTLFQSKEPIMAEFDLSIEKSPTPLNGWLVLQVDSANGGPTIYFRRTPLNWIQLNWNGTNNFKTCIQTDNLPLQHCRIAAFFWNIDKKEIKMKINNLKLYHLSAPGITEHSKAIQ